MSKPTNILAVDTAGTHCSVMLMADGQEFFCSENTSQRHSRHILKMIDQLMNEAGIHLDNLHLLAWNAGPGSFTGLRIGASVVQALAYSFGLPVLSLSSLEILAYVASRHAAGKIGESVTVAVAVDARMNGVYWATFIARQGSLERLEADQLLDIGILDDKRKMFGNSCLEVGDAWQLTNLRGAKPGIAEVSAADVMELALIHNKQNYLDNPAACLPNYVHNTINWQKRKMRSIN
jgi:tRNA threonylcarbamoyladenosine biosynthesis protein TsaB